MYAKLRFASQWRRWMPHVLSFVAGTALLLPFWRHQDMAFAQLPVGTLLKAGSDLKRPVAVRPDDLRLKAEDGRVFATLLSYSAELTVLKGATVQIRSEGGWLANIRWSKGKARVNEVITLEGFHIVREISYTDGVPRVSTCSVNGNPSTCLVTLRTSKRINFRDPVLAPDLKPYQGGPSGAPSKSAK